MNKSTDDNAAKMQKKFDDAYLPEGEIESLRDRVYRLENAVSHMAAFIANHMRLSEDEFEGEYGLTDW